MSLIYQAVKRAERRPRAVPVAAPVDGRARPDALWDASDEVRLEYERIQGWMTNRAARHEGTQAVMVVACRSGNGATTTAAGLATTLARRPDTRVLVADANMRTPSLDRVFGAANGAGLSDWLAHGDGVRPDYLQPTARPNLAVLTTGRIGGSPLEILAPGSLSRVMAHLRSRFDHIVLDAAPLLEFPDAHALAPHVDAVLVVVEADRTLVDDARRVMRDLERSGAPATAVVLNRHRDHTPPLLRRWLSRGR